MSRETCGECGNEGNAGTHDCRPDRFTWQPGDLESADNERRERYAAAIAAADDLGSPAGCYPEADAAMAVADEEIQRDREQRRTDVWERQVVRDLQETISRQDQANDDLRKENARLRADLNAVKDYSEHAARLAQQRGIAIARLREALDVVTGQCRKAEAENARLRAELEGVTDCAKEYEAAIKRVRALHVQRDGVTVSVGTECGTCFEPWPCATVDILNND